MNAVERQGSNVKAESLKRAIHVSPSCASLHAYYETEGQSICSQDEPCFNILKGRHNISTHKICSKSTSIPKGSVKIWLPMLHSILKHFNSGCVQYQCNSNVFQPVGRLNPGDKWEVWKARNA
ncbi:hypothetical protein PR048_001430 [Dryococelus australis]|uniref:Uncharacterized protein n=1 Tax=Dryococelus australis TaxID=614101 RepID=A0ABQ9IHC4_9NEOP|nr:hypothetical protein PR048_001430 [Dryococelus australis]